MEEKIGLYLQINCKKYTLYKKGDNWPTFSPGAKQPGGNGMLHKHQYLEENM